MHVDSITFKTHLAPSLTLLPLLFLERVVGSLALLPVSSMQVDCLHCASSAPEAETVVDKSTRWAVVRGNVEDCIYNILGNVRSQGKLEVVFQTKGR